MSYKVLILMTYQPLLLPSIGLAHLPLLVLSFFISHFLPCFWIGVPWCLFSRFPATSPRPQPSATLTLESPLTHTTRLSHYLSHHHPTLHPSTHSSLSCFISLLPPFHLPRFGEGSAVKTGRTHFLFSALVRTSSRPPAT